MLDSQMKSSNRSFEELIETLKRNGESSKLRKSKSSNNDVKNDNHHFFSLQLGQRKAAMSNTLLRSAMVSVSSRSEYLDSVSVAAQIGTTFVYTGESLSEIDYLVFEYLVNEYRKAEGNKLYLTHYQIAKNVFRDDGQKRIRSVQRSIYKINTAQINIENKTFKYSGKLIGEILEIKESGRLEITVNERFVDLFDRTNWTQIDMEQREKLGRDMLARKLYSFYATHKKPHDLKISTLYGICRSKYGRMNDFKIALKKSLLNIDNVFGWRSEIIESNKRPIDCGNDLVRVKKNLNEEKAIT